MAYNINDVIINDVIGEKTYTDVGNTNRTNFTLNHIPIVHSTVQCSVVVEYENYTPVLTDNGSGSFNINEIVCEVESKVIKGRIDYAAGWVELEWTQPPGPIYLVVNYRYEVNPTIETAS